MIARHIDARGVRLAALAALCCVLALTFSPLLVGSASAVSYVPVSGAGSTWSQNALNQWIADVNQYGMRVNYAGTGSSDGRSQFLQGTVDFAASDIPFQSHPTDGSAPELPAAGSYAYIPVTAGGTAFMYNLTINGQRVTDVRLSGSNIAKIFAGVITSWSDPAIAADNPQLTLPNETIVPVVRSDGSGSTFQFSQWMISQYADVWNGLCNASGRAPACGPTSYYPTVGNMIAQNGDLGVAGYVAQNYAEGAIGYVNYSYALNAKFPVVKMLNLAGYYTEPTPDHVAVSLVQAQVDTTDSDPSLYLTQKLQGVYSDSDPRTYPLSSYSYMIVPTTVHGQFSATKGKTLAAFSYYAMCQGQQESASLGYSPMPYNLVNATFDQIKKIPGQAVPSFDLAGCKNPTIDPNNPSDPNLLAATAPQPPACDKQGSTQCATGTAGNTQPTPLNGGGGGSAAAGTGGTGSGGAGGGSSASGGSSSGAGASSSSSGSQSGGTGSGGANPGGAGSTPKGGKTTTGGRTITGAGSSSGGATGTNRSPTGVAAGSSGGRSGASSAAQCDAATGICNSAAGSGSGNGSSGSSSSGVLTGSASPAALTTTLAVKKGWTGTQTLMTLSGLLLAVLVLAPGIASRMLSKYDK